jgi:hypothetical protein
MPSCSSRRFRFALELLRDEHPEQRGQHEQHRQHRMHPGIAGELAQGVGRQVDAACPLQRSKTAASRQ